MRAVAPSLFLTIVIFTSSCVSSLNPLYTESDLTADPNLVGTWIESENGETWTFSNCEKFKYAVVHVDSDRRRSEYDARLLKLEDKLLLDLVPIKSDASQSEFHPGLSFATHTFVHVVSTQSTVEISYMEPRWLKDFLSENPKAIRHEKINGEIVLTSTTKETQKFILAHMNTRGAFSRPVELTRKLGGL